jgi:hypothetical protein
VGLAKAGVVGRNHRPRHDDRDLAPPAALEERVVEGLGQQVADLALGLRAQNVERRRRNDRRGHLGADRQEADLRAVAVGDHDLGAAALGQRDETARRGHQVAALDLGGARFAAPDQGVAAQGDGEPGHP